MAITVTLIFGEESFSATIPPGQTLSEVVKEIKKQTVAKHRAFPRYNENDWTAYTRGGSERVVYRWNARVTSSFRIHFVQRKK